MIDSEMTQYIEYDYYENQKRIGTCINWETIPPFNRCYEICALYIFLNILDKNYIKRIKPSNCQRVTAAWLQEKSQTDDLYPCMICI